MNMFWGGELRPSSSRRPALGRREAARGVALHPYGKRREEQLITTCRDKTWLGNISKAKGVLRKKRTIKT